MVKTKQLNSNDRTPKNQDEPKLVSIESRVPLNTLEDSCMTKFGETDNFSPKRPHSGKKVQESVNQVQLELTIS